MKLLDKDIRKHLYTHAFTTYGGTIIDELGLTRIIADLAVLNGSADDDKARMVGYEIKSDGDTLTRLPLQANMYSKVFTYSYLVATTKHIDKAWDIVPDHWGVIKAETKAGDVDSIGNDGITLTSLRDAQRSTDIHKLFIARLLWKEELLNALERLRIDKGVRSKNKLTMQKRLIHHVSVEELQAIVCKYMLNRDGWKVFRRR